MGARAEHRATFEASWTYNKLASMRIRNSTTISYLVEVLQQVNDASSDLFLTETG